MTCDSDLIIMNKVEDLKVGILGLGYVGLPVALGFARNFSGTVAFDVKESRVNSLKSGVDDNEDVPSEELKDLDIFFTTNVEDLKGCNFFIVAVPTPIDEDKRPDLRALIASSKTVASVISKGAVVVYESTVYPGVTEEVCGKIIEKHSGLKQGKDFFLGYSPERINPGDKEHTLERIIKVVSGENKEVLELVSDAYSKVVTAGVFKASSIKVAEAAKAIENTQRDLNIALMNELAIIFDKMDIPTKDVLDAAGTKWNFLKFTPGLVGGHCIGVDPYYLTTKAQQLGYHPQVILAGRRINDDMGYFVAKKTIKLLTNNDVKLPGARVAVLGVTFKENVADVRNSRIPDVIKELKDFGINVLVHDPIVDKQDLKHEYGIDLVEKEELKDLDAIILAVSHDTYKKLGLNDYKSMLNEKAVLLDVKSILDEQEFKKNFLYWRL